MSAPGALSRLPVGPGARRVRPASTDAHVSLVMPAVGIVGVAALGLACLVAASGFRGTTGEIYSPFNHFISELGEGGVSSLAVVFDVGVMLGGLSFAIFILGVARTRGGVLGAIVGLTGLGAGVGGALVGVFPMNELGTHVLAALAFFALSPVSVGLASIAILRRPEPRLPRVAGIVGIASAIVFVAFLLVAFSPLGTDATLARPSDRPALWHLPILEWAALASLVAWVLVAGLAWLRDGSEDERR